MSLVAGLRVCLVQGITLGIQMSLQRAARGPNNLSDNQRSFVTAKVNELTQKLQMPHNVEVLGGIGIPVGLQSMGDPLLPLKPTLLGIDSDFFDKTFCLLKGDQNRSHQAATFLLAHELSLLKHRSPLLSRLLIFAPMITHFALTILYPTAALMIPLQPLTLLSVALFILSTRWMEKRADLTAVSILSEDEVRAGIDFWKNSQLKIQENRNRILFRPAPRQSLFSEAGPKSTLFKRWLTWIRYTPSGDDRWNILAPSLSSRIAYLEKALDQKIETARREGKIAIPF